jgi:hypothetical protein
VQFREVALKKGSLIVAVGQLKTGGLDLGLLRNGLWYRQTVVTDPGYFMAVVEVEENGVFTPMLTNATLNDGDLNQFTLDKVVKIDPEKLR